MSFDPNDPRLTAYALGELDEPEVAAIEARLLDCAESRAAVEEIRLAARLLTEQLSRETGPGLAPIQIAAIEGRLAAPEPRSIPFSERPAFRFLRIGLAAGLLGAIGLAYHATWPAGREDRAKSRMLARSAMPAPRPAVASAPAPPDPEVGLGLRKDDLGASAPSAGKDVRGEGDFRANFRTSAGTDGAETAFKRALTAESINKQSLDAPKSEARGGVQEEGLVRLRKSRGDREVQFGGSTSLGRPISPAGPDRAGINRAASEEKVGPSRGMTGGAGIGGVAASAPTAPAPTGPTVSGLATLPAVARAPSGDFRYAPAPIPPQAPMMMAPRVTPGQAAAGGRANLDAAAQNQMAPAAPPAQDNLQAAPPAQGPFDANRSLDLQQRVATPAKPAAVRQLAEAEVYKPIEDNPFIRAAGESLSTFSIDVDTASYSNVRRILNEGKMPPPGSARIEEMVNYFPYEYPGPNGDDPFSIRVEVARCPWNAGHRLARIGLKGREIAADRRPASNLVFLIDVSGSMAADNKLPLVKEGLRLLVEKLGEEDRVGIVVYAARSGVELPSTEIARRAEILSAIDRLNPGGSTNGGAGIALAYEEAAKHFIPRGTNRVILCTDGDFNVGVTDDGELTRLIEAKAKESKVFLSVLGFGVGNLKDARMKDLADHGNGNYAYIDTRDEARKVLVDQMTATLDTIAKDVKVQVEFNPARVAAYRLIGYENRMLKAEEFNDDAKDAGEIGAGHTVTALYELVPPGKDGDLVGVDNLKYTKAKAPVGDPDSKESMTVKLRFKGPEGDVSRKIEVPVVDDGREYPDRPEDYKFAAAVAEFGMLLRNSPYKGNATLAGCKELAEAGKGADPSGYRAGFVDLVGKAEGVARATPRPNR